MSIMYKIRRPRMQVNVHVNNFVHNAQQMLVTLTHYITLHVFSVYSGSKKNFNVSSIVHLLIMLRRLVHCVAMMFPTTGESLNTVSYTVAYISLFTKTGHQQYTTVQD